MGVSADSPCDPADPVLSFPGFGVRDAAAKPDSHRLTALRGQVPDTRPGVDIDPGAPGLSSFRDPFAATQSSTRTSATRVASK